MCVCVSVCFMTLSSVDEREEVSSVIYSHRPSCPICVSLHRFVRSHTHLSSLSHFSQPPSFAPRSLPPRPPLICLCVSDNVLALSVHLLANLLKAVKPALGVYYYCKYLGQIRTSTDKHTRLGRTQLKLVNS